MARKDKATLTFLAFNETMLRENVLAKMFMVAQDEASSKNVGRAHVADAYRDTNGTVFPVTARVSKLVIDLYRDQYPDLMLIGTTHDVVRAKAVKMNDLDDKWDYGTLQPHLNKRFGL